MLSTWKEVHVLREGMLVVIAGQPNVGKSTLLNCLLGTDRAIVTDIPGTTRDTIEECVIIAGLPIRLVDTAGLRDTTDCRVERFGIERARDLLERADLVLYVVDASVPLDVQDMTSIKSLDPCRCVIAANKIDIRNIVQCNILGKYDIIQCSMINGIGLDKIRQVIAVRASINAPDAQHAVISERHRQAINDSLPELMESERLLYGRMDDMIVPAISHVRRAIECIGMITGRTYDEELLHTIFSRFCIGK